MLKQENPVLVRGGAAAMLLYAAGSIAFEDELGLRHVPALIGAVLVFGGLAWLILTVRDARHPNWPWLLVAGVVVAAGVRYGRMGVLVAPESTRLISLLRSERFSWAEVDHFAFGTWSGIARLHLRNGRRRTIAAIHGSSAAVRLESDDAVGVVAELNRLAKLYEEGLGTTSTREC